jgi:hypothetical protein
VSKRAATGEENKLIASLKLEAELKSSSKKKSIHIMLKPAIDEKLRKLSEESGVSVSKIVNAALEREIMGQA